MRCVLMTGTALWLALVPSSGAIAETAANPPRAAGNCHRSGEAVTLRGIAAAQPLTMADGSRSRVLILHLSAPVCVLEISPETDATKKADVSDVQIIGSGDPPPAGATIELMGTLTTENITQNYTVPTAITVKSGRLIATATGPTTTGDRVPTVGCAADGQMGSVAPPSAITAVPTVPREAMAELAYYASAQLGVLAPRGWHCFGLYGSNGDQLIVTPEAHNAADLLKSSSGLKGPAIQLSDMSGSTSGRFTVAKIAARLFPVARSYVEQVINEGLEPKEEFQFGPYPNDILTRRSDTEVEFQTPANSAGIGTRSRLAMNNAPISGVAILFPKQDMDLVQLNVRLPPDMAHLVPAIIAATERQHENNP